MKLIFLGTGGFQPTDSRHTLCLMIPELGIVFDAGTGAYRIKNYLATKDITFFMSHAHLDHIVGLTYLLPEMTMGTVESATVHGEQAKLDAIQEHLYSEHVFPVKMKYAWTPLDGPVDVPGGGRLTYRHQEHPGGSIGYRIDWPDRSIAYVTDTTANGSPESIDFVRGVDLLVHECDFEDKDESFAHMTGHSHTTPVAELARDAEVGRLMLVHFDPLAADTDHPIDIEVARNIFPKTTIANDLDEIDF
ncbi:MBL fold metallo-hydrolase [Stratiformator vulcanicus]|uniref:Ribonuclease BN n=1 Tax=Stratiformator vulcanicus TaxID=2527980 RepID=A0A517R4P4_9PLAN|nr:MBL fold metallo-hydrolase [Stratiformator vulcanicus]QDT38856.1 Ribonuclease BN [Stratiformator vulcanicus]